MIDIPIWIIITISFVLTTLVVVKSNGLKGWTTLSLVCFLVVCVATLLTKEDISVKIYAVCLLLTTGILTFVKAKNSFSNVSPNKFY